MSTRSIVEAVFVSVAHNQGVKLAPITDDLPLVQSGLDSLCFAVIVARLEDELGIDPFARDDAIAFPVVFGDFVKMYETVAA